MLRSLRISVLAGLVAFVFAACGGGSNPPDKEDGGTGQQDGPRVQFDGPRPDGSTTPDGSTQQDGGTPCSTECATTGGAALAGLCKCTSDCTCPNACANPWPNETPPVAGSCWKPCTATTECATGTEECVGITETPQLAACLPKGTIAGTFTDIPTYLESESPAQGVFGSSTVAIAVGDVNVTFGGGLADKYTSSSSGTQYWRLTLFPVTGGQPDLDKMFMVVWPATDYGVKTWDLSTSTTVFADYNVLGWSGSTVTSQTITAWVLAGTLEVTAAGAGAGAALTGSITNGQIFKWLVEICGSHSSPC